MSLRLERILEIPMRLQGTTLLLHPYLLPEYSHIPKNETAVSIPKKATHMLVEKASTQYQFCSHILTYKQYEKTISEQLIGHFIHTADITYALRRAIRNS